MIVHEPGYGPVEQTMKFWSVAMAEQYVESQKPDNVQVINGPYECERDEP